MNTILIATFVSGHFALSGTASLDDGSTPGEIIFNARNDTVQTKSAKNTEYNITKIEKGCKDCSERENVEEQ
jgi:hypothetical protein